MAVCLTILTRMSVASNLGVIKLPPYVATVVNANAPLFQHTLGIEITDPALAAACDLGNIDPQHGFMRLPVGIAAAPIGRAAIEVALGWPLPPSGSTLVTIRLDADAAGAMAVLSLRAQGRVICDDRVALVARSDCFDFGPWADWVAANPPPLPGAPLLALVLHPPAFRALSAYIQAEGRTSSEAVQMMADWLTGGPLPAAGTQLVAEADTGAAAAWRNGDIKVSLVAEDRVALICSDYRGAVGLGYRFAPVVIAEGEVAGLRKLTVAQFATGHADFAQLSEQLAMEEAGWGGSATILGSPQGVASNLPLDRLIVLMRDYLL